MPFVEVKEADVSDDAQGLDVLKLLVASGLAASKARRGDCSSRAASR